MYCLDTNVIIDLFHGDKTLLSKFDVLKKNNAFSITPVVLCELFKGAFLAKNKREALKLVEAFVQSVEFLNFNEPACRIFGEKYEELKLQGKQTQESDLMIASIALAHNNILVARNQKDFIHIKGLKVMSV